MATRIEKPVVGETYWDKDGDPCTVLFVYDRHATGYWTEKGKNYGMTWYAGKENERWPLFATDPTKPEPLPALDLSKPVKRRDGLPVRNVRQDGDSIAFESLFHGNWICSRRTLAGLSYGFPDESNSDLVQCTRRDWTQADVPFGVAWFRRVGGVAQFIAGCVQPLGIGMFGDGFFNFSDLARDWEYTVDGKTWNRCCIKAGSLLP
jgi:hypothetical protein